MPPYLPATGHDVPPGPARLDDGHAETPAGQSAPKFGRRPAHAAPPLPRQPQLRWPQPWPLQQASFAPNAEPRRESAEPHQSATHQSATHQSATLAAKTPAPARARTPGSAMTYASLGFLAGIVFWHAVGFWTLVHDAVFSGPRLEAGAKPLVPVVTAPPDFAFDEEKLRYSARRPTAVDVWQRPQDFTTGSIKSPSGDAAMPARPQARAPVEDRGDAAPVLTAPGAITWKPAVSKAP
ncbi:MAG: hypothetical protein KJ587_07610 [Alphaproteobacteria bacterium]|nr:hypothetical protein [Alphaproteobacteria bacterium]